MLVSSLALLVVLIISMVGASFFAKASMGIFVVIVSALCGAVLSFLFYGPDSAHIVDGHNLSFTGMSMHTLRDNLHADFVCPPPCGRDAVDDGLDAGGFAGTLAVFGVVMPSSESSTQTDSHTERERGGGGERGESSSLARSRTPRFVCDSHG